MVLILASARHSFAQKVFSEGTLTYKISIQSSKGESALSNNLSGAELKVYLKPSASRTEMINSLGTESTVYDSRQEKGFILKEYSGQKLMITATKENWKEKNRWNNNLRFSIDNSVVNIEGYQCKKATASTQDGRTFEIYFTPDIVPSNKDYNNSFDQLPGLPVQYSLTSGNLTIKHTLNRISYDAVPMVKFDIPKAGYRVMTYEENQQLKKEGK